jgi:hypothetical protein
MVGPTDQKTIAPVGERLWWFMVETPIGEKLTTQADQPQAAV